MNTLLITFALLVGITSCNGASQTKQIRFKCDRLRRWVRIRLSILKMKKRENCHRSFLSDATGKHKNIQWNVIADNGNKVVRQQAENSGKLLQPACVRQNRLQKIFRLR